MKNAEKVTVSIEVYNQMIAAASWQQAWEIMHSEKANGPVMCGGLDHANVTSKGIIFYDRGVGSRTNNVFVSPA